MEVVEARVRAPACDGLKGRGSQRKPKGRAGCVHRPNNTLSHLHVYIQPPVRDAFHNITLMLFRFLLSRDKLNKTLHSHGEWTTASLEILVLNAIVQCRISTKILALSGEEEGSILVLEEIKKIMRHMSLIHY